MTRERLLSEMSSSEFQRWAILEQIEPFGTYGETLRHACLMAMLANIHRKADTPPFSHEDFMPLTFRPKKSLQPTMAPEKIHRMMMLLKEHQDSFLARQRKQRALVSGNNPGA